MLNRRIHLIVAACVVTVLVIILGAVHSGSTFSQEERYISHIDGAQPDKNEDATAFLRSDFTATAGFTSHLPLVVIDTNGVVIPANTSWDYEKGYAVPLEGVEPYVAATISIYDSEGGNNSFTDTPTYATDARIKRRGNSSMSYEKAQWKIHLLTESGQKSELPLLGMDASDNWVLNGAMIDKSLMRNYLAYTLAAEFMPYVADVRYCEVFIKDGDSYAYQGVYLLIESMEQGDGRVEISDMTTQGANMSYMVRRDRWDPDGIMLDTYATREGLSYGYFGLLYPKNEDATPEVIKYVESDLSAVEQVLYSDDPNVFLTYPDYINVDSFVDYFLFNEFFTNYDAGNHSTYLYKDVGGKLCIGPVWDFDGTIDNYTSAPLDVDVVVFHEAPWFDRLVLHRGFVDKLSARYAELRRSTFDDDHVGQMIDDVAAYLGPAQERDWAKWAHIYMGQNRYTLQPIDPLAVDENEQPAVEPVAAGDDEAVDSFLFIRQTEEYSHELVKLRYLLRTHADILQEDYINMRWQKNIITDTDNIRVITITAVLFVLAFFASVIIARRQ